VHIDWASLARVAVVAAAAALTIVVLISLAVVSLSHSARRADGPDGGPHASTASVTHTRVGTAIAALCVLAAGLIVCYGLYLIIA
jgi:heme/copper-type cytochrome/quinol oxidase subunit 2